MNNEKEYELVKFEDGDFSLDVNVSYDRNDVLLTANQMALLFERNEKTIRKHINSFLQENEAVISNNTHFLSVVGVKQKVAFYSLNVILAVGQKIRSPKTKIFENWTLKLFNNNYTKKALVEPIIQFKYDNVCLDVTISPEEDTVWLTQTQICELFDSSKANISEHINHILDENELDFNSVVRNFRTTGIDGKAYNILHYNLDMIIAVGYRVNTKRGTLFRRWATNVLKQYLLNGFAIDKDRIISYQSNILQLQANVMSIEKRLKGVEDTLYATNNQIIFEGEILEPYTFIVKMFHLAKERIIIIDNYADEFILQMLTNIKVDVEIYTSSVLKPNKENITVIYTNVFHDRFIIIDNLTYSLGTSINSIGKKRFIINKLEDIKIELLLANIK